MTEPSLDGLSMRTVREIRLTYGRSIQAPVHPVRCIGDVLPVLRKFLDLPEEAFVALYLDLGCRIIGWSWSEPGSVREVPVYPAGIYRRALMAGAAALLVAHNHPSGDPAPSGPDQLLTQGLVYCGSVLGIPLMDHLVVAGGGDAGDFGRRHFSFREAGRLEEWRKEFEEWRTR